MSNRALVLWNALTILVVPIIMFVISLRYDRPMSDFAIPTIVALAATIILVNFVIFGGGARSGRRRDV